MNSSQIKDVVVPPSTLKRIYKDLNEINKNPLFGASLCMPNQNDPLTLRANIFILDGPYKDLLIHMVIHLPSDYPITGPAANIAPGLKFGHKYHEHLYDDLENGNQICADLLTNMRFMYDSSKLQKSGWTPSYTLSAVLLQLQVFFADPDLPKHLLPTTEEVEELRKHVRAFKTTIQLTDGQEVTHSFDTPYPPLSSMVINQKTSTEQISKKAVSGDEKEARRNAEEWLHCAISKCNYFDESQPILGYPLDIRQDQFGRYWPTPVVEMISYEAYILKVISDPSKLENYEQVRFKSSFGELYNFWMPVFINEEHWTRSYQHILNAISVVRKGFRGLEENDFKPQMVLEVLPVILNKMLVQILQGKLHESMAAIQAYSHFYRLLIRLLVEFPELQQKIDASVEAMLKSEENRNKQNLGDMGEFLIKLALSKYGLQNASINEVLIEEYLARKVLWVLKEDPKILHKSTSPKALLRGFMGHVQVGHQLLVVAVETVKLMINDASISLTDNNFGILTKKTMDTYRSRLSWIKETVGVNGNWEVFVESLNLGHYIRCDEDMARMIQKAFEISARQGYTWSNQIASFQGSKNQIDDIPYNPNFNFARATKMSYNQNNSFYSPAVSTQPKKITAIMSNATWDDLKVELKGFDVNPIISIPAPKGENNKKYQSSEQKTSNSKSKDYKGVKPRKFTEESKKEDKKPILSKKDSSLSSLTSKTMTTTNYISKPTVMSSATWGDLKVELKGFDANPIITIPASNNKSHHKFTEESKEHINKSALPQKVESKLAIESKDSNTSNSTTDNSTIVENEARSVKEKSNKSGYGNNQRNNKGFVNDRKHKYVP